MNPRWIGYPLRNNDEDKVASIMDKNMKRTINKTGFLFVAMIAIILLASIFVLTNVGGAVAQAEGQLIETRSDLLRAIKNADDGAVIMVGDIDFHLKEGGAVHEAERLIIDKNITIKCGKEGEKAHFSGGSFLIEGTKVAGVFSAIRFKDIVFDGGEDVSSIVGADWELIYDEGTKDPVSNYTLKAQYAIMCKGNVQAEFSGCEFSGYMHEQGAAVRLYYGDYSGNTYALYEYGDNSTCQAELGFYDCKFAGNAALYGGGAVYSEGHGRNVSLCFDDCVFANNVSGASDYSQGGGAIFATETTVTCNHCTFNQNEGNHFYEGAEELYDPDMANGGAVCCYIGCDLRLLDCVFSANHASNGGAVALSASTGEIDGCVFDGNVATPQKYYDIKSLSSCGGIGGALYFNDPEDVLLVNTTITRNTAQNAYGAVFTDYSKTMDIGARNLEFAFCSVADNVSETKAEDFYKYGEADYEYKFYPSSVWNIPYVKTYGCVVADALVTERELPAEENGYCYFAGPKQADTDGYKREYKDTASHISFASASTVPKEYVAELFPLRADKIDADMTLGASDSAKIIYADPIVEEKENGQEYGKEKAEGKKKEFPAYAIALIVIGALLVAGLVCILVMSKKKAKQRVKVEPEVPSAMEPDVKTSLDDTEIESILSRPVVKDLSEREKEVLAGVLAGKKRKEIAKALFISESTVKKHIASIYTKLHVSSRSELLSLLYYTK